MHLDRLVASHISAIIEIDPNAGEMDLLSMYPPQAGIGEVGTHIPLAMLNGAVLDGSGVYYVPDLTEIENPSDREQLFLRRGLRSYLAAPILVDAHVVGVVDVIGEQPNAFDKNDISIVQEVADMLAVAMRQDRYQRDLVQAKEQAEEMNRLKSAFLASMSHEIRTPLVTILGFSDVLAEEVDGVGRPHVELVRKAGRRLMSTLDSVLDLARFESGTMRLNPTMLDVRAMVGETVQLFAPQSRSSAVTLQCNLPSAPLFAEIDPAALNRVLNNLLSNALKFTTTGAVTVTLQSNPHEMKISVKDTGIGIDATFLPYIFDEFKQESQGMRRSFEGVGLGLTITKHLVALMGGQIDVESTKGVGTEFHVCIPLRYQNRISTEAPLVPVANNRSGTMTDVRHTILFVEDQVEVRILVELFLRNRFEIKSVATIDEGIAESNRQRYDLVVIDIHMGEMRTGTDLAQILRDNPTYAHVPLVACTAYALPADRERFLAAGFDGYLSKPFTKMELEETIVYFLQDKKLLA